jgi:ABC-type polysaccharide/polyol phosphate transport system ATPase subunit
MSSDEIAIRVRDVSKHYLLFNQPQDRLKQSIVPRLQRLAGRKPKRYYRDFAALSHVSFDVRRGETVGIIGRNGSGKSTLLQIVCGTLRPNAGTVEVNGRIAALLELGAGFNPEFTGRENVYLNASILGLASSEIDARFDDIARFADIGDFIDQPVKTYSSGMYVRLAFATAINVDPDILVVDEALAVGDEAFQRKCYARIEQIQERGGTILFVTHGAQTVVQLCTRALLFDRGNLLLDGRPKFVTSQYQRLVNASSETAGKIRAALISSRSASAGEPASPGAPSVTHLAEPDLVAVAPLQTEGAAARGGTVPAPALLGPAPAVAPKPEIAEDHFDPNLTSQSIVAFDPRGAHISEPQITTLGGEPVNVLRLGKRYLFRYRVDFDLAVTNVGVGMSVGTVEGVGIGGAQTDRTRSSRTPSVSAGAAADVVFGFTAIMLPGTFFLSCGVSGILGEQRVLLHRIKDALAFRVAPEPELIAFGRCDISAMPRIILTGESDHAHY